MVQNIQYFINCFLSHRYTKRTRGIEGEKKASDRETERERDRDRERQRWRKT